MSPHPPCWLLVLPPCRPSAQTRNNGGEWLFFAVVGVRAAGAVAWQSPTTLITFHVLMFPLILPAGCWCRRPAGHPHKHATTAESGCFCRCWCSCRWLCGMAITNNINYFSCFNVSTSSLLVVGVAALQAIRTNTQQRRRVAVCCD